MIRESHILQVAFAGYSRKVFTAGAFLVRRSREIPSESRQDRGAAGHQGAARKSAPSERLQPGSLCETLSWTLARKNHPLARATSSLRAKKALKQTPPRLTVQYPGPICCKGQTLS